jgi:hypothetical protein
MKIVIRIFFLLTVALITAAILRSMIKPQCCMSASDLTGFCHFPGALGQ